MKKRDANHWEKGDHLGARFDLCTMYGHILQHYPAPALAGTEDTQPLEVWHIRLSYLNQSTIQSLTSRVTRLHIGPARHLLWITLTCLAKRKLS